MKKISFGILCFLISGFAFMTKAEDLNDVKILEQHFDNTQDFEQWYSQLNQENKNLILAGTVYNCRPDLTKIALNNGGNAQTGMSAISVTSGHDEDSSVYIYATTSDDEKDFMIKTLSDGMKRSAKAVKEESCGHTFAMSAPMYDGKMSLLSIGIETCDNSDKKEDMLQLLLKKGQNINQVNISGNSPLATAIKSNNIETVKFLLQNGADFNSTNALSYVIKDYYSYDPKAVNNAMWDYVISYLQTHKLLPEAETDAFIHWKLNDSNFISKLELLDLHPYYDTQAAKKGLLAAADKLNNELITDLVSHGVDVNYQNNEGKTALFFVTQSSRAENIEIVKYLLDNGANANIKDKKGKTAFDGCEYAICKLNPNSVRDFDVTDENIVPSIDQALFDNDCEPVIYFVEKGVDPYIDIYGSPLLFKLFFSERRSCLEKVLKLGVDLNKVVIKRDSRGIEDVDTALVEANRFGEDLISLLKQYGATETNDTQRVRVFQNFQSKKYDSLYKNSGTQQISPDTIKNEIKQKLKEENLKDWEIEAYKDMLKDIDYIQESKIKTRSHK